MAANRTGFHDRPVGYKGHAQPTPYLGGGAVLAAFLVAVTVVSGSTRLLPIVIGAVALWVVGTVDDRRSLSPGIRVAAELAAALLLWATDLGWQVFDSDLLNLGLTGLWVVALVNAFNLMDNMDGAATSVAAVTGAALGALAIIEGDTALGVLGFALAGSCLGFLPFNLANPARIFLGDGGSIPVGFVLSAGIMQLSDPADPRWEILVVGVLLAGLPILDTALVLVSRRRRGLSFLTAGRDHLAHRLRARMATTRNVAVCLAGAQAALCAAALWLQDAGQGPILVAGAVWFIVAAAAVAALERQSWSRVVTDQEPPATTATAETIARPRTQPALPTPGESRDITGLEAAGLALVAAVCAVSPFAYGFYDISVWGPIALVVLAFVLGMVIARPALPRRAALIALAGLALLWLLALVSSSWAESADQALTEANRWLLYAAMFGLVLLLVRTDFLGLLLLAATTAGILVLAGYLVVRLLSSGGPSLFLGARLNEPLGYVNGQAGYLLLAFWPLVAAAEFVRGTAARAIALGAATFVGGLILLSETRSVIPAVGLSAFVVLAFVPGRARRAWALLLVAAGLVLAAGPLLEAGQGSGQPPAESDLRTAVAMLFVSSVLVAASWGALIRAGAPQLLGMLGSRARTVAGVVAALLAVCAIGGVLIVASDPIDQVREEARAFTELQANRAGGARFLSGGGNRYDYWRVAWMQFRDNPLRGVGAGNYDRTYFVERRTSEDIRQPHSIELQVLSETGILGGAALALFVVSVLAGFARPARARRDSRDSAIAVAAGGLFVLWLTHTSLDWLHLIPGVTGVALCAAGVLVGPWRGTRHARASGRWKLAVGACALAVFFGAAMVGRATLAEHYRAEGRDALVSDPVAALEKADDALALNDESLQSYYLRAAAIARLGRYREARAALLEAARREPHDFVTWVLLGDLAVRRGDLQQARSDYQQAVALNPTDPGLKHLADDPASGRG